MKLRDAFFEAHVTAHPEDASTLGLREHASRLSDPSLEAAQAELAELRVTLAQAADIDVAQLGRDERLDLDAVVRAAKYHARWYELDADASNLELSVLPNGAVQHGILHMENLEHAEAVAARALSVPEFLARHLENLRRGAREGRAPDRAVVAAFLESVLPGVEKSMASVASEVAARALHAQFELPPELSQRLSRASVAGAEAYAAFARVVAAEIAPLARPDVTLGEAEVMFRLRDAMGLESSIDELTALAESALEGAHASLVENARNAGNPNVRTAADARDVLFAVLEPKPATIEEAIALYDRHLDAATRFVAERAIVPIPEPLALRLEPLPAGIADGSALTNWPAPLLDPRGKGHALYAADPQAHPLVQTKHLAVHEGIPGHYLQSAFWQQGTPSPVRFLGVTDDIAMSRGWYGTMLSVEGWAVHMEQVMRSENFYDEGPERIFFAWCEAIRAMRVLLDLGLHARGMNEKDALRLVMNATLMPEGWARSQIVRSKRMPLQCLTYLVGSTEIAALRAGAAGELDSLTFHRALLESGPVPPSRLVGSF